MANRPHALALIVVWLVATVALVAMLMGGVRQTDAFDAARTAMQVSYVAVLLWYLAMTGKAAWQLPEIKPLLSGRSAIGRLLPALLVALLFLLNLVSSDGSDIVMQLMILATLIVLLVWFRKFRISLFLQGVVLAVIAYVVAIPYSDRDFITPTAHVLLSGFVPFMYVAGVLMVRRTGLGEVQLAAGRYGRAILGFLWGVLLFVPLGLFNAADGSPGGDMSWMNQAWLAVSSPFFSGIVEEVWWRLLLVPLVYLMLRPALRGNSVPAVVAALLFSAIVFGLGHGYTFGAFFRTGLLYGLPMAAIFARRDWEHAVGGHYTVNMIPNLSVFLGL